MNETRTFGVELEFNTNGQGQQVALDALNAAGLPAWAGRMEYDGSELEIPSPILKGKAGTEELATAMAALKKAGCKTNRSDGLHTHHCLVDVRDDVKALNAYIKSWFNNQSLMWKFVAPRRENSYVCYSVKAAEAKAGDVREKYRALSFRPLNHKGTAELRCHEGTLDFPYAEAWLEFGQAFFEGVKEIGVIKQTDSAMEFLTQLPLEKKYVKAMCNRVNEYDAWKASEKPVNILVDADFTGRLRKTTGSSGRFE